MKFKKLDSKGFVLAETLVVTVFLMLIFTMIYSYFYPLIGEYEKREVYDDVDSTYAIYWIKKMIEDPSYSIVSNEKKKSNFRDKGYFRVECSDIANDEEKRQTCVDLVNALQVENCDPNGEGCNIFVTKYRIGGTGVSLKNTAKANFTLPYENCDYAVESRCVIEFYQHCSDTLAVSIDSDPITYCDKLGGRKVFSSGLRDYIISLPDYSSQSINGAKYRVIASFKHTKDNNNYYSYATIEVSK